MFANQGAASSASAAAAAAQSTANAAQSTANTANTTANAALPKAGGTMTGALILAAGEPSAAQAAAPKTYVDTKAGAGLPEAPTDGATYGRVSASWGKTLPLSGGTMTGPITLAADPAAALQPATKQYVDATNIRYRNRIINGDMAIDQRNGGTFIAQPATTVYVIDRWKLGNASNLASKGSMGQIVQNTAAIAVNGFQYNLSYSTTTAYSVAAADNLSFYQTVEGINFNDANWGTANALPVTLEFWAQSSVSGTYAGSIKNGATGRSYVFTYTINATNTWQKIRINIPGDTAGTWNVAANAAALFLQFGIGVGSTYQAPSANTWVAGNFTSVTGVVSMLAQFGSLYITGVALMVGAAAANAEPEFRKFSDNMLDCQRYFSMFVAGAGAAYPTASSATAVSGFVYPVTMRAGPTITFSAGIDSANAVQGAISATTLQGGSYKVTQGAAAGNFYYVGSYKADADF